MYLINELCPRGYAFMHISRSIGYGGGVGLLYKKNYKTEKQNVAQYSSFEYMETLIRSPSTVLRIGIVYRPPPSAENGLTVNMFFDEFSDLLERLAVSSGKLVLLGDFNFHVDDLTNPQAARFLDLLDCYNLKQHITGATHKANHTLDLVITRSCEDMIHSWSSMDPQLSDHKVIHTKLHLIKPRLPRQERQYRKLRSVDPAAFRNDVIKCALFTSEACNVVDLCDQYDSELLKVVDSHAPLKTCIVSSRPSAPWYTEDISKEKCKRRQLERRWRKSGLDMDKQQYYDQCKRVRDIIKSSKMNYYSAFILENKSDHKVLFNTIDRLLHRKSEKHYPTCNSTAELCNSFANFFSEKIVAIRQEIDGLPNADSSDFERIDEMIIDSELTELFTTSVEELSALVGKISTKSCSLDPVPASLLKNCITDLLPVICQVVNLSFESTIMPTSMKQALLSPLLKKQTLNFESFSNFRPISNLKFLSKVIEKVAASRLWDHLRTNDLNEIFQSAYKKYHSCKTALVRVQNDILKAIDNNKCVILLLLDLSDAFDTVDHDILLNRLQSNFGIKGKAQAWFRSYLTDRTHFVKIDGSSSSVHPVSYGVPQGSVLGPLLYLLYTSPLGNLMRKHDISFHLYADDNQIYTTFSFNNDVELSLATCRVERCLADITNWMSANKLKLNTGKTELLVLHSKFRQISLQPNITVKSDTIKSSEKARNIGVTFDRTLTMSPHINEVIEGAFYHLRNIAKIRKYISADTTEVLVHSFVSSRLDFCNSLLYGLPKSELNKLQNVQNAAARVIACLRKYDHISPTLRNLHWLPVQERIVFKINLMCFKIVNNIAPKYLQELVCRYEPTRILRSSADKWRLTEQPYKLKTYGYRAFSVVAPKLWNTLPVDIRSITDINTFKSKLKTHLFKLSYDI